MSHAIGSATRVRSALCRRAADPGGRVWLSTSPPKKRARQNLERRARNRTVRSRLETAVKDARAALAGADGAAAGDALRKAEREIRKAASKGVLTKKQASRRVSRLASRLNATS